MSYNSLGCERLGDELLLAELAVFGMIDEFFQCWAVLSHKRAGRG
jgi:hypothetical protein